MDNWKTELFKLDGFHVALAKIKLDGLSDLGVCDTKVNHDTTKGHGFIHSWRGMRGMEVDVYETQQRAEIRYQEGVVSQEDLKVIRESIDRDYHRPSKPTLSITRSPNWTRDGTHLLVR